MASALPTAFFQADGRGIGHKRCDHFCGIFYLLHYGRCLFPDIRRVGRQVRPANRPFSFQHPGGCGLLLDAAGAFSVAAVLFYGIILGIGMGAMFVPLVSMTADGSIPAAI